MTMRTWTILVILGYVCLAIGAVVTTVRLDNQANNINHQAEVQKIIINRLSAAAGAYCEVGLLPDAEENAGLVEVANAPPVDGHPEKAAKHPVCKKIVERLLHGP